jgi:hypothetical protein
MIYQTGNATETPMVNVELERLGKAQAELCEGINNLDNRLAFIMREPEPQKSDKDMPMPAEPAKSQLSALLHQRVVEAESLVSRVSAILRRMEI